MGQRTPVSSSEERCAGGGEAGDSVPRFPLGFSALGLQQLAEEQKIRIN
jgi:hypothetical protein